MNIKLFKPNDIDSISQIAQKLHPNWFDQNALKNIPIDIQLGKTYIASNNNLIIGFIVLASLEGKTWINWIGVDPDFHGKGAGTLLLEYGVNFLTKIGVKKIYVDTVVEQTPADGTYDQTIKWYNKQGFYLLKAKRQQTYKQFTYRRGILIKNLNT